MADSFDPLDPPVPKLDVLTELLADLLYDPEKLKRLEKAIGNAIGYGQAAAHGGITAAVSTTKQDGPDLVGQVEGVGGAVIAFVLAHLVGHLLGIEVPPGAVTGPTGKPDESQMGRAISKTVLEGVEGGATTLAPGDEGAQRLVGMLSHLTLLGWGEGLAIEWLESLKGILHPFHEFSELGERLINGLGLNRLTRVALRPLAQTVIATPLQWKMNQKYRPKMLSAEQIIKGFHAGRIDEATMREVLTRDGLGDEAIAELVTADEHHLSANDANLLFRAGKISDVEAIQFLRDAGIDEDMAQRLFDLEELKDVRAFQLESAHAVVSAYVDNQIDDFTLDDEIDHAGLDDRVRERLRVLARKRRALNQADLSRGDIETAVLNGIATISDYRAWLQRHNYNDNAAITLELMLLHRRNAFEDAQKERARITAERAADKAQRQAELQQRRDRLLQAHAHFSGTPAQAEQLVERGFLSAEEYRLILIDTGITSVDATKLAALAQQKADAIAASEKRRQELIARQATPELSLQTLESAVLRGVLTLAQYDDELARRKYSTEDVTLLTQLLERKLADQATLARRRADAEARLAERHVSLADQERAVRDGLQTVEQFRAWLASQHFGPADIALVVGLLQKQLEDDTHAAALRQAAAARLAASQLSLEQEERAVIAGVQTRDQYRAFLGSHGFHAADVEILVALLDRKIADVAAAQAKRDAAAGQLAAKSLSLSQVETAVVAGVLSLDDYRAFLARHDFVDADIETLVALLQSKVEDAAAARTKRTQVEAADVGAVISLADVRRAVLAGVRPIEDYGVALAARGYDPADSDTLVQLLQVDLDQRAAAAAIKANAAKTLAAKNLALDEIERQVHSGIRSTDDYAAFLRREGIAPEDVAAIVDLLEPEL